MENLSDSRKRISSIDLLRGLVMIIMALDHTRDFFHYAAFTDNPLNFETTTPELYFTRWITHFCAPVFVFLSGTSAWMQGKRKSKKELSLFLIKRGFWLIFVELIIVNLVYGFSLSFDVFALSTIWSIAISMIILGLVIWLPFPAILMLGLLIVLGHNALDYYEKANPASLSEFYHIMHRPNLFDWGGIKILALYPFLPWAGLMIIGYCFGKMLTSGNENSRKKRLLLLGLVITVFFLVLRAADFYGDPDVINGTDHPLDSVYTFLETNKYPPSLLFMCMTIGPAIIFLALTEYARGRVVNIISVYGRVALFYYVVHFFLIHLISTVFFLLRGHSFKEGTSDPLLPYFIKPGEGYSLGMVYIIWISIVIALYPVCRWYDNYKQRNKQKWWLSYM